MIPAYRVFWRRYGTIWRGKREGAESLYRNVQKRSTLPFPVEVHEVGTVSFVRGNPELGRGVEVQPQATPGSRSTNIRSIISPAERAELRTGRHLDAPIRVGFCILGAQRIVSATLSQTGISLCYGRFDHPPPADLFSPFPFLSQWPHLSANFNRQNIVLLHAGGLGGINRASQGNLGEACYTHRDILTHRRRGYMFIKTY